MKNIILLCTLLFIGGIRSQTEGIEPLKARSIQIGSIPHIYADAVPTLQEMIVNDLPDLAMTSAIAIGGAYLEQNSNRKNNTNKKLKSLPKI